MEYINRLRYKGTVPTLATSSGLVNNAVYDDMGIIGDPEPPTPTPTPTYCTVVIIGPYGGSITALASSGGTQVELPASSVVEYQTTIELNATADSGFSFAEWQITIGEESFTNSNAQTWITANGDVEVDSLFMEDTPAKSFIFAVKGVSNENYSDVNSKLTNLLGYDASQYASQFAGLWQWEFEMPGYSDYEDAQTQIVWALEPLVEGTDYEIEYEGEA
jgi:hypothetical protein